MDKEQSKKDDTFHLHDRGYKRLLSFRKIFRQLMEGYVSHDWVKRLDYEHCEKQDKSYIAKEYEELESDVLYKTQLFDEKKEVYLYILVEHQSTVDFSMAFRILSYLVMLWDDIYKNTDEKLRKQKGYRFPPVFSLVLYNGEGPWTAANSMQDIVECGELFSQFIPNLKYEVINIAEQDPQKLEQLGNSLAGVFLLESQIKADDFKAFYHKSLDLVYKETDNELLKAVIDWICKRLSREHKEELPELVDDIDWTKYNTKEIRTMLETIPERFISQGREEGKAEGTLQGELRALLKILARQFGQVSPELEQKLKGINSLETLDRLLDLALDSKTLEEFKQKSEL